MKMNWRLIKKSLDTVGDHAEFVAAPRPSDPIRGAYHDYSRWVCDSYAGVPNWAKTAATVAGWGNVNLAMQMNCGEYLGENFPQAVPPFSGGQCPVVYLVDLVNQGSGPPFSGQTFVEGPISGVRQEPGIGPGTINVLVDGANTVQFRVGNVGEEWSIATVSRIDNMPDNCGDPSPVSPTPNPDAPTVPPNPPGGGQPPTWEPGGDGPVYNPGPIDNPYGPPIDFPPIDPWGPGAGDDDSPFDGPPPYSPLPPGDQGEPGAPVPGVPGEDAEGEAPEGMVLVGLKIDLTVTPEDGRQYAPGVWRGPCYVYMGGDAGLDQDYAGSMLMSGQFIHAERENLTRWRVSVNTGFEVITTPFYREAQE